MFSGRCLFIYLSLPPEHPDSSPRHRLAEMEESVSVSTDQLATIERISSELKRTREQCSTADKVVEKMKTAELELSEDLQVCSYC